MHELGYAEQLYRSLIKERPNYTDAYMRLGAMAEGRGNAKEASTWYKEALTVSPHLADAYTALAKLHVGGHDFQVHTHTHTHTRVFVCVCVCTFIYIYIYIYIYIGRPEQARKDLAEGQPRRVRVDHAGQHLSQQRAHRQTKGKRQGQRGQVQGKVQAGLFQLCIRSLLAVH